MANTRTRTAIGGILNQAGLGSAFQFLRVNSGATSPEWVSGGVHLIAETVLGSDTASIDFSSIPATFRHLRLDYLLRSTVAANNDSVVLTFNADTTNANYDRQLLQSGGGTNTGQESLATTGARNITLIPAASSPSNHFGNGEISINFYAGTTGYKQAISVGSAWRARTTSLLHLQSQVVSWASTTAVNQITLAPSSGPNFLTGSRVALYGIG
jgi:hypothetical protein